MKLKDLFGLVTGVLISSVITAQDSVNQKIKRYNKIGNLKVDTSFNSAYLEDFMVPYQEFADLHNCKIKVRNKNIKTTMAARPHFFSLLLGKKNRRYVILVNKKESFKGVHLKDVPSEARIGLFAHELMHIRDYESRKVTGVMERGLQYLSQKGKRQVEHYTDSLTIAAGFGQYLYHWANYVLHDSDASDDYKHYKSQIYMTPVRILTQIEESLLEQ
ncbi:hypothetical protein KEM09_07170 [Carboxylicivirga mesophila]|uniref:DUF4157 domain-containing protein n=1 Tax=Carboxylicivirga mesophila TaxID=1166478 RepID=A0ABS5K865_9BACT|nr:hypothetical protein [Carboxylicivirga mesophila]MBS2211175.1 hypothetical protein [Carboxylicivirga mesophila]